MPASVAAGVRLRTAHACMCCCAASRASIGDGGENASPHARTHIRTEGPRKAVSMWRQRGWMAGWRGERHKASSSGGRSHHCTRVRTLVQPCTRNRAPIYIHATEPLYISRNRAPIHIYTQQSHVHAAEPLAHTALGLPARAGTNEIVSHRCSDAGLLPCPAQHRPKSRDPQSHTAPAAPAAGARLAIWRVRRTWPARQLA